MATLNFPDAPDTGDIYTDSNSGFTYEWNGTVWISKDPSTASNIREIDDISSSFNGSTTAFTLNVAANAVEPANVQQLIISVGGVMQNAGDDYTVSGSTLTFTTAPTAGLTFFGTLLGTALSLNTVADGSVSPGSLTTTSNYVMGGLTVDQSAGIITAYQFKGDGSGLTGVASTDNIKTSTDAYFGANVSIAGSLTVQGTETIINVEELNVQDKTIGIGSTSTPTATTQDGAGAIIYGQTHIDILYDVDKAALGISTSVNVAGFVTATRAQVGSAVTITNTGIDAGVSIGIVTAKHFNGLGANFEGGAVYNYKIVGTAATIGGGVTINNTGIDAGIGAGIITAKEYYGDATNMTGAGSTFQALSFDPFKSKRLIQAQLSDNIALTFNHGIEAGNAAKEVTLRTDSPTGTIVQSFGVGSSITYSAGQAIINPTDAFINENEYFVVVPEGAFKKIGTANSSPLINTYSFLTAAFTRNGFACGENDTGQLGQNDQGNSTRRSSPVQIGSNSQYAYAAVSKQYGNMVMLLEKDVDSGGNKMWYLGSSGGGKSGTNSNTTRSSPTQVGSNNNWSSVAIGEKHCIGTKTDGTIWGWGFGDDGCLAQASSPYYYSSPVQLGTDTTWSGEIYAGKNSSGALKTDGTLWTWGINNQGNLGLNDTSTTTSPRQVGTNTTWKTIAKGGEFCKWMMATKTDGTLWTWGNQYQSGVFGVNLSTNYTVSSPIQVGTNTTWHGVSLSGGQDEWSSAMALKTDGTLWSWGIDNNGSLGLGGGDKRSSPTQIGTDTNWGTGDYTGTANRADYTFAISSFSAALKTDGTLWTWGNNDVGGCALNDRQSSNSPRQVGSGENWKGVATGGISGSDGVGWYFEQT